MIFCYFYSYTLVCKMLPINRFMYAMTEISSVDYIYLIIKLLKIYLCATQYTYIVYTYSIHIYLSFLFISEGWGWGVKCIRELKIISFLFSICTKITHKHYSSGPDSLVQNLMNIYGMREIFADKISKALDH